MLSSLSSQHATAGTGQAVRDLERGDEGHHLTDEVYDRFVVAEEIPVYLFFLNVGLGGIGRGWGGTYVFGEEERDHDDCSCYYAQQRREVSGQLGPGCVTPADGIANSCGRGDT
jgi:hypothetical protein